MSAQRSGQSLLSHAAVVLAAGRSQRLGQPKQALQLGGQSLEARALQLAARTSPAQLLLVRAAADRRLIPALGEVTVTTVVAPPGGMGISIRSAALALDPSVAGILILSVDQPHLDHLHLLDLLRHWREQPNRPVASAYAGIVGNPAVLPYSWRSRLLSLDKDQGAREWLRDESDLATVSNPALAADVDTPADLRLVDRPDS